MISYKGIKLLDIAKSIKPHRLPNRATEEEVELALAWLKNEVSWRQCVIAYQRNPKSHYGYIGVHLARAIQKAYDQGRIVETAHTNKQGETP
jgi:hypothetical protein